MNLIDMETQLIKSLRVYIQIAEKYGVGTDGIDRVKGWIKEVENKKVTSVEFAKIIRKMTDYWSQKNREYGNYLLNLIEGD